MTISIPRSVYDDCEEARTVIPPGRYLLGITAVEGNDASDYLTIKYKTIMPHPDMKGEEKFWLSAKALKRLAILVKRAGLVSRGDDTADALDVDVQEIVGTTWVVDIANETFIYEKGKLQGQQGVKSLWDGFANFWPSDHPDVALFMASLQQRTQLRPAAPATQQAQRQTAAVANGADDF